MRAGTDLREGKQKEKQCACGSGTTTKENKFDVRNTLRETEELTHLFWPLDQVPTQVLSAVARY